MSYAYLPVSHTLFYLLAIGSAIYVSATAPIAPLDYLKYTPLGSYALP